MGVQTIISAKSDSKDSLSNLLSHYDIESVDVVVEKIRQYQVGSKKETFTPIQSLAVEQGALTGLISRFQPVFIKTDAGGLASFRFRGTSSNHTTVVVRGLDINSQTLGSYNANNAPVFLFDQVEVLFGSSSATHGSGSIGGNVRLQLQNSFIDGVKGEAKVSLGSFGQYMAGAKVFAGNRRFESVTRLVYYERENNFPFENTAYYNFETHSYSRDEQRNARIENANLIQQFNYKWNDHKVLSSMFWLAKNRHEAQPNMAENKNPNTRYIEDQNVRTWIQYDQESKFANVYVGAGYVFDDNIDYSSKSQKISTQRFVSEAGLKKTGLWWNMQLGGRYEYIDPNVYAYDENVMEQRSSVYTSFLINPLPWLKTSLNLRQQFVSHFNAPFTPALGIEARLLYADKHTLALDGNIQRAYRIPTLNDRFWGQDGYSGNCDIKPEDASSVEMGVNYLFSDNINWTVKLKTNVFYMDVDQWLQWIQGPSGWYADNIMNVVSKGLEANFKVLYSSGKENIEMGAGLTYNTAKRTRSKLETDQINQQLEYVPEHIANAYLQYSYGRIGVIVDGHYVGKRYYNQIGGALSAYKIFNSSAYYKFKWGNNIMQLNVQANNVFCEKYQNQYQYAMPEDNYCIAINYKF